MKISRKLTMLASTALICTSMFATAGDMKKEGMMDEKMDKGDAMEMKGDMKQMADDKAMDGKMMSDDKMAKDKMKDDGMMAKDKMKDKM